jgi:mannose-6-phosphate isomerase-like protein (cupin superfamily)
MVESGYAVVDRQDAPVTHMADVEAVHDEFDALDVRNVDEPLATEEMKVKVWTIPPGKRMGAHGHERQEELYYVLQGTFDLRIGPPDEAETVQVDEGTFFAASPGLVREYTNVGEDDGRVLVVAAPNVDEDGIPEHEL